MLLAGFLWALHGAAHAEDNPRVSLVTNKGAIEIELLPKFAPSMSQIFCRWWKKSFMWA